MAQPFRIEPALPVHAYKTYAISAPIQTHMRPATCAEVECAAWAHGWSTTVDVGTDLGVRQAGYIVGSSGRKFNSAQAGGMLTFTFPSGQRCFREHHVPLEREPIFIVRGGDHRGNPGGERRVHSSGADWAEDFAEHQSKINQQMGR
jgi:hypothetical protein